MQLSIIINHYKLPNVLVLCIEALIKHIKTISYEIIVTDSETQPGTAELLREKFGSLPHFTFIASNENIGYGKSVNKALTVANGEYIFIINADIITRDEKSIKLLMDYLATHSDTGLVGPRLRNIDDSIQKSCFREPSFAAILARRTAFGKTPFGKHILERFEYSDTSLNSATPVEWLMGSALLTKKEYIDHLGGFDERFFMYFEDVDWAKRFWKHARKVVYVPQSVYTHYHIRASHRRGLLDMLLNPYTRIHIMSFFKYLWKWKIIKLV